jgi:hypothetical protein
VQQSADRKRPQTGIVHPETAPYGGGKYRYALTVVSAGPKQFAFYNIKRFRNRLDKFIHSDIHSDSLF